jgi:hypothetical protein
LPIVVSRPARALPLAVVLVCALGAVAGEARAQVIRVAGAIKDDAGRPVRGAVITAENPDQAPPRISTTSSDNGHFGFIGIRRGLWTFTIEAPGFETIRFARQLAPGLRFEPLDLRLARKPAPVVLPLDGTRASDIQERIERAESIASSGDLDGAIAAWQDLLAKVPALTSIHLRIGALYERKPDLERALAAYRQLLALEPDNEKARAAIDRLTTKRLQRLRLERGAQAPRDPSARLRVAPSEVEGRERAGVGPR